MANNNIIAQKGIEQVINHLEGKYKNSKIERVDSSRSSQHKGYDILVTRENGEKIKIEVKSSNKSMGIPDAHSTEFKNKKLKLVSDYLYVVRFMGKNPEIYELSKRLVDSYSSKHRVIKRIRFASALKTELKKNAQKYKIK